MGGRLSGTVGSSTTGVDPPASGDAETTDSTPGLVVLVEPLRRDVAIERTAEVRRCARLGNQPNPGVERRPHKGMRQQGNANGCSCQWGRGVDGLHAR